MVPSLLELLPDVATTITAVGAYAVTFEHGRREKPSAAWAGSSACVYMVRAKTLLVAAGLALAAGGCGSTSSAKVARPQTASLGWRENCGTRTNPLPISTRRLVVGKGVWRVDLSFQNRTSVTLFVQRPHFPGGTYFGLEPFKTALRREVLERAASGAGAKPRTIAERFDPPLPRRLPPGRGWSGEFSGRASLPAGVPIRVVLGRFVALGQVPSDDFRGFLCISARVVRLS
jgi:hypothetical protein